MEMEYITKTLIQYYLQERARREVGKQRLHLLTSFNSTDFIGNQRNRLLECGFSPVLAYLHTATKHEQSCSIKGMYIRNTITDLHHPSDLGLMSCTF